MDTTAEILFGKTRRALMLLLFEQPNRCFYIRELSKLSGISPGAVQHELVQLTKAELVIRTRDGNRVYYQANTVHPVFPDLKSIIHKTWGVPTLLAAALQPLRERITFCAIYGSFAKGTNHARSDIDLLIVGEIGLEQTITAIVPIEEKISREINVRLFSVDEFYKRLEERDPFIQSVMNGLLPVFGKVDDTR
jgi:predicted nucleotidyltransferase